MVQQYDTWDKFRGAADWYVWLSSWMTEVNGVNAFLSHTPDHRPPSP